MRLARWRNCWRAWARWANDSLCPSSNARRLCDCDSGTLRDERAVRLPAKCLGEAGRIEPGDVAIECCLRRRPRTPRGMLDVILQRSAVALAAVAPVVLGDELFQR